MKNMMIIFSVIVMAGCSIPQMSVSFPYFETVQEANLWIHENVEYRFEYGYDDWATPDETLMTMQGDCEDMTALLVHMVGYGEIVGYVRKGTNSGHMVAYIDGIYYDPVQGNSIATISDHYDIVTRLSLDEYLFKAVYTK